MVVRKLLPPTELKTSSLEMSFAGTEVNSTLLFTVISKIPGELDLIRTAYVWDPSSVCKVTKRS